MRSILMLLDVLCRRVANLVVTLDLDDEYLVTLFYEKVWAKLTPFSRVPFFSKRTQLNKNPWAYFLAKR